MLAPSEENLSRLKLVRGVGVERKSIKRARGHLRRLLVSMVGTSVASLM
jgi:hypothetical protein